MADEWLYHLPAFLDRVREQGAHGVVENVDADIDGVLYHHRGIRVPGYNATFVWGDDGTFELVVDGVGDRAAWATFDADRAWDFYFAQPPNDTPSLAWLSDTEFETDEADRYRNKAEAIADSRFSFGLYLQPPPIWQELEARAEGTDAPCFIYRPSGRTFVPEGDLNRYVEVLPPELLGEDPPGHLGLVAADFGL